MHAASLPKDWPLLRLADVFHVQLGKMLSGKARAGISPKPYLRNKNVQWGAIDTTEVIDMDFNANEMEKFRLCKDDLLMCEGGEPGRTAIWRDQIAECYYQKAIHRLRPVDSRTLPEFYLYWFRFAFDITNFYGIAGASSTIAHLPAAQLKSLTVPVPELGEQRRIAAVLSAVQRAIERQERLIAVTAELKKALMHKLFTEGTRGEPLKQTEIGPVPKSWDIVTIGELFKFSSGKSRPKDAEEIPSADKPYPIFGGNGVMGYAAQHLLDSPALVIGRVGVYCGCAHHTDGAAWISDNALYAKWVDDRIDTRYAREFFEFANLNKHSSRAAQPLVTQGILSSIKIPLPPKNEQRQMHTALAALAHKIERHQRSERLFKSLFSTLLHQLMTAKIRVHDLDLSALEARAPEPAGAA